MAEASEIRTAPRLEQASFSQDISCYDRSDHFPLWVVWGGIPLQPVVSHVGESSTASHFDGLRRAGPRRIAKPLRLPHPPALSRQQATCFPAAGTLSHEMPMGLLTALRLRSDCLG